MRNPFAGETPASPRSRTDVAGIVSGPAAAKAMRRLVQKTVSHTKLQPDRHLGLSAEERIQEALLQRKERLRLREQEALSAFFEKDIAVPPLPADVTLERMEVWEKQRLALHYLPREKMGEIQEERGRQVVKVRDLDAWVKRPNYFHVEVARLERNILDLRGGWMLVDTRPKPMHQGGDQMYEDDFLGPVLAELTKIGVLDGVSRQDRPATRFHISMRDLMVQEALSPIAQLYGIDSDFLDLPKQIEFNLLGNMHYPEWGMTDCDEFFDDKYYQGFGNFIGGSSASGGLSYIFPAKDGTQSGKIGFRFIVRF